MSESSIKVATEEDIPLLVDMSLKFAKASNYFEYISEDRVREIITGFIRGDKTNSIIFLYENKGMLIATVTPFIFGNGINQATEIAWWVDPEERKSGIGSVLLSAFEYWAKQVGCKLLSMSCLDDSVAKFYEKNGYKLYERAYFKEI